MIEVESGSQIILLSARTTSTKAKVHIVATQLSLALQQVPFFTHNNSTHWQNGSCLHLLHAYRNYTHLN